MDVWLAYWRSEQIERTLDFGDALDHIASNQLKQVRIGDVVWIVGSDDSDRLFTIGSIVADQLLDYEEACEVLGNPKLWRADWHVLAAPNSAGFMHRVPLSDVIPKLRFESVKSDRINLSKSIGLQLQTMRELTSGSAKLIQKVWSDNVAVTESDENDDFINLDEMEELDTLRARLERTEQNILRNHILGDKDNGRCIICGREYPAELLVAAHIKRRADCDEDEKRDLSNLVPMCRFGCDELFERGYIAVVNGKIVGQPTSAWTDAVEDYVATIDGQRCLGWSEASKRYFRWHAKNVAGV